MRHTIDLGQSPHNCRQIYHIYSLNNEETAIASHDYRTETTDQKILLQELLEQLSAPADKLQYRAPLSGNVQLLSESITEEQLLLDFSEEYYEVKSLDEKLMRAAIVQSLLQIDGIDAVSVRVEGEPLKDDEGYDVGLMNEDDIVDTTGSSLSSYQSDTLKLYFADQNGSKLVKQEVDVHYSSNVLKEKLIVEKLMQGPSEEGAYPTINPAANLLSFNGCDKSTFSMYFAFDSPLIVICTCLTPAPSTRESTIE